MRADMSSATAVEDIDGAFYSDIDGRGRVGDQSPLRRQTKTHRARPKIPSLYGSTYKPIINKAQPERPRSVPKKLTPVYGPHRHYATPHCNLYMGPRSSSDLTQSRHPSACASPRPHSPPREGHNPLPPQGGVTAQRAAPVLPLAYTPRRGRLDAYPPRT